MFKLWLFYSIFGILCVFFDVFYDPIKDFLYDKRLSKELKKLEEVCYLYANLKSNHK